MRYKLVLSDSYLFSWDNIPGNDNLRLIEFLNRYFGIKWVDTAKIEKIDEDKTIKIFSESNFVLLKLDQGKTNVDLQMNDSKIDSYIAKIENNKLNVYERTRDIGENVFFNDLPFDYEVYILYYPGTSLNKDLTDRLRNLGDIAGKNLFVNIAKLDDPNYKKIVNKFEIRTFPTIIVTAIDKLASPSTEHYTAYVKIDNKKLLNSPDLAIECIDKVFHLFIQGEISKAISEHRRIVNLFRIKSSINGAIKGIGGYLKEWEITISFIPGKLEIKPSGGG